MPKILPNIKETILKNADARLKAEGYEGLKMRALAKDCNIAVGTLYNYFDGVDSIIAEITMADWRKMLSDMEKAASGCEDLTTGMRELCKCLQGFAEKYRPVWNQYSNKSTAGSYIGKYHGFIRAQLAERIELVLETCKKESMKPLSAVLAETVLACLVHEDMGFEQIELLVSHLAP